MWDGYESELIERSYEDRVELNINVLDNKIANECCKDCINKCDRDGTYSYDKRNEKINVYCIATNTN